MSKERSDVAKRPLDRRVGRYGHLLPAETKPGDKCPWCEASGHTGVLDPKTGKYVVCKVCGDRGVIDSLSIEYYGTPEVTPNVPHEGRQAASSPGVPLDVVVGPQTPGKD